MIKFLYKINKKFDHIPENRRFLTFMGMILPPIICISVEIPPVMSAGWIWILLMLAVRMSYMHGWLDGGKDES